MINQSKKDVWSFWENHRRIFIFALIIMLSTTPMNLYFFMPDLIPESPFFRSENIIPFFFVLIFSILYFIVFWGALNFIYSLTYDENLPHEHKKHLLSKLDPLLTFEQIEKSYFSGNLIGFSIALVISTFIYTFIYIIVVLVMNRLEMHWFPFTENIFQRAQYNKNTFGILKICVWMVTIWAAHVANSLTLLFVKEFRGQ